MSFFNKWISFPICTFDVLSTYIPSSAEKGQIPSSDETVNGLGVEKVERFTCRISVQGGVSERVRWAGRVNFVLFSKELDPGMKRYCFSGVFDQMFKARR